MSKEGANALETKEPSFRSVLQLDLSSPNEPEQNSCDTEKKNDRAANLARSRSTSYRKYREFLDDSCGKVSPGPVGFIKVPRRLVTQNRRLAVALDSGGHQTRRNRQTALSPSSSFSKCSLAATTFKASIDNVKSFTCK
uniref:Uncharacterized protein n=1 Tax=Trichuris muris TaxID=70415 RepID=A0A5S6QQR8_TRIMR